MRRFILRSRGYAGAIFIVVQLTLSVGAAQARDICRQYVEGNTRHTLYCDDPYVCDRANPGKCKPGPELQRKLDEERKRAEEQLNRARARLDAQIREMNREQRRLFVQRARITSGVDDRRTPLCGNTTLWGSPVTLCIGDAAANMGPIDYSGMRDPKRVPTTRPRYTGPARVAGRPAPKPPANRSSGLKLKFDIKITVKTMIDSGDVDGADAYVEKLREQRARADDDDPRTAQLDAAIADGKEQVEQARAATATTPKPAPDGGAPPSGEAARDPGSDPPPASPAAAAKPSNDEALCSFLIDLSADRPGRLSAPVPDFCKAYAEYLASLAPPAPKTPPIQIRADNDTEIQNFINEYTRLGDPKFNDAVPPGLVGN